SSDEYVISADEKTSIQARLRTHPTAPPAPGQCMRVEFDYDRGGALVYLAAWDVRRAKVFGRCDSTTGIAPFDSLVQLVMSQAPYRQAKRVFLDRGQLLLAPWRSLLQTFAKPLLQPHASSFARSCQLAQPGRDLLFSHPEKGANPKRLHF